MRVAAGTASRGREVCPGTLLRNVPGHPERGAPPVRASAWGRRRFRVNARQNDEGRLALPPGRHAGGGRRAARGRLRHLPRGPARWWSDDGLRDLFQRIGAGSRCRRAGALPRRADRPRDRDQACLRRVPPAGGRTLRQRLPARADPLQRGTGPDGAGDEPGGSGAQRAARADQRAGNHWRQLCRAGLRQPRALPAARRALDAALPNAALHPLHGRAGAQRGRAARHAPFGRAARADGERPRLAHRVAECAGQ